MTLGELIVNDAREQPWIISSGLQLLYTLLHHYHIFLSRSSRSRWITCDQSITSAQFVSGSSTNTTITLLMCIKTHVSVCFHNHFSVIKVHVKQTFWEETTWVKVTASQDMKTNSYLIHQLTKNKPPASLMIKYMSFFIVQSLLILMFLSDFEKSRKSQNVEVQHCDVKL